MYNYVFYSQMVSNNDSYIDEEEEEPSDITKAGGGDLWKDFNV